MRIDTEGALLRNPEAEFLKMNRQFRMQNKKH